MTEEQKARDREGNRKRVRAYRDRMKQMGIRPPRRKSNLAPEAQKAYWRETKRRSRSKLSKLENNECSNIEKETKQSNISDTANYQSEEQMTGFVMEITPNNVT